MADTTTEEKKIDYSINYDDERFKNVESQKSAALGEHEAMYDDMISGSDKFYEEQIQASKDWADTQTKLQNEQTDFAIQKIEQQKEQAKKDYNKEQSGAYADWQKQSDRYGARSEQLADNGLKNTGYSESSQVSMYNDYQNRVMTARESYTRAVQDFNNGITEARLQNNSALAEIRFNALQQQLELSLQGFQAKNQLLQTKYNQKLQIEDSYYNRYKDVLSQINTENALAEQIRQFEESIQLEREQFEWQKNKGKKSSSSGSKRKVYDPTRDSTSAISSIAGNSTDVSTTASKTAYAKMQLNKAIAGGATKDKVSNAISNALKNGAITKKQATELRKTYTPRGVQY